MAVSTVTGVYEPSFAISLFRSVTDVAPDGKQLNQREFATLLSHHEERERKDGPTWSPTSFRPGSPRSNSTATFVSALVLDIDAGVQPDLLRQEWWPFTHVIHSTHGHTEAFPKFRVVFPFKNPVPTAMWNQTYLRLSIALARGYADPSCKDVARVYYLPSCRVGSTCFADVHEGELLDSQAFPEFEEGDRKEVIQSKRLPIDYYNKNTNLVDLLSPAGWTLVRDAGGKEYWARPGKNSTQGHSGCSGVSRSGARGFYVFSSNADPLAPGWYSMFDLLTMLQFGGDSNKALGSLHADSCARTESMVSTALVYNFEPLPLTRMSDIEPVDIKWLWYPLIPIGKLTILAGMPGVGKSLIAASIAAKVTRGEELPSMLAGPESCLFGPSSVLWLTTEDGLADTLHPRLSASGADLSRIVAYDRPLTLDGEGMSRLAFAVKANKPHLVVIDPFQAYFGAGRNMNQANETRPFLQALSDIAAQHDCAVLVLAHPSKAAGTRRAVNAILGSVDIAGAARSVLLAGRHEKRSDRKSQLIVGALLHVKCNVGPMAPGNGYEIRQGDFRWTGETDITEHDLLGGGVDGLGPAASTKAEDFLIERLKDGAVAQAILQKEAHLLGISDKTLQRAKKRRGVLADKAHKNQSGFPGWIWQLPTEFSDGQDGQDGQLPLNGQVGHLDCPEKDVALQGGA